MHRSLRNHFGRTIWYSWVKRLKWKLGLVSLEIVLILMQGRCMVCTEDTICLEINLDAPDELLDDVCHMESCFGPFGDIVNFGAR